MNKKPYTTEYLQSWSKRVKKHRLPFCVFFSVVLHLLAVIMFLAQRRPVVGQVEEGFTVTLSTIKRPALKREARLHKPVVPIRSPRTLAATTPRGGHPQAHQDSEISPNFVIKNRACCVLRHTELK